MSKVIQNDAEYEKARIGLLKMAEELENPDPLNPEETRKTNLIYDRTAALMKYYSRGRDVQQDPAKAALYDSWGWDYQKFD